MLSPVGIFSRDPVFSKLLAFSEVLPDPAVFSYFALIDFPQVPGIAIQVVPFRHDP